MIRIFKDKNCTRPANESSPAWLPIPAVGGRREMTLWLADDAFGKTTAEHNPGDTAIYVSNADKFPRFGWVRVGHQHIHFTGNDGVQLTGIPATGNGAVQMPVMKGTAVRSENREYTTEALSISPTTLDPFTVNLSTLAETWGRVSETMLRRDSASFTLNGSPLMTTIQELTGYNSTLLHYDFTGRGPADVIDLTTRANHAYAQGGTLIKSGGSQIRGIFGDFSAGVYLAIPTLANQFPDTGSLEIWASELTTLSTLFSVTDDMTGAEKFAVRVNNDSTLRVSQEKANGLIKNFNAAVPTNIGLWHQIVVTWNKSRLTVYVDGARDGSWELDEPVQTGTGPAYLGKGSSPFTGKMIKVRLWNETLGGERVATMWNGGNGWPYDVNEPVLGFKVNMGADGGDPTFGAISLNFTTVNGYDHDPFVPVATVYASRRDHGVGSQLRVLSADRKVPDTLPAFEYGSYRWRENEEASREVVRSNWNVDMSVFTESQIQSGIGHGDDLALVSLTKVNETNSIQPVVKGGDYFISTERSYLPVKPVVDIFNATADGPFTLSARPRPTTPVFCGRFRSNQLDRYVKDINCRYVGKKFAKDHDFDSDDPGFQFLLDRAARKLRINQKLKDESGYIGIFPTVGTTFTFRLPVHPIFAIKRVYISSGRDPLSWSFNQAAGTLTVTVDPSWQSKWAGQFVFADYTPGFAVYYESGSAADVRTLNEVELNPAYAGVSDGVLYLQHKVWSPKSLQLQVDKARIPYTNAATEEEIQFGPVFPQDFAVLTVTAFGNSSEDLISGARLAVRVDKRSFAGAVNYQDPTKQDVHVMTGADGSASLVYTPGNTYGLYIATSAIAAKKITLPELVDIGQLYDANTGEFVLHTYAVLNDDPYLGKVGADTSLGEVLWAETGDPATAAYRTNGRRLEWKNEAGNPVFPEDLLDENGVSFRDPTFSGKAKYITYSDDILLDTRIGAYFVAFAGKVTIRLYSEGANVLSNPITLRVVPPEQITEISYLDDSVWAPIAGYITMNDFAQLSGRLNVNRLAGGPLLQLRFSKRI